MAILTVVLVVCMVLGLANAECNTLASASAPPQPCKFPFTFRGNVYNTCTSDGDALGNFWCQTLATSQRLEETNTGSIFGTSDEQAVAVVATARPWGYCDAGCPLEQTLFRDVLLQQQQQDQQSQTIDLEANTNPASTSNATIIAAGASAALGAIVALVVVIYITRRGGDEGGGVRMNRGNSKMLEHRLDSIAKELGNSYVGPSQKSSQKHVQGLGSRLVSKLTSSGDTEVTGGVDSVTGGRLSRNTSADSDTSKNVRRENKKSSLPKLFLFTFYIYIILHEYFERLPARLRGRQIISGACLHALCAEARTGSTKGAQGG